MSKRETVRDREKEREREHNKRHRVTVGSDDITELARIRQTTRHTNGETAIRKLQTQSVPNIHRRARTHTHTHTQASSETDRESEKLIGAPDRWKTNKQNRKETDY